MLTRSDANINITSIKPVIAEEMRRSASLWAEHGKEVSEAVSTGTRQVTEQTRSVLSRALDYLKPWKVLSHALNFLELRSIEPNSENGNFDLIYALF